MNLQIYFIYSNIAHCYAQFFVSFSALVPLSSSRQYLSCDDVWRLRGKKNCSVLCCVRQLCTMICTQNDVSSFYSCLDWVLSHWAHFTVHRFVFIGVYSVFLLSTAYCQHGGWTWWDWSLILSTKLPSVLWHCWLGHLTCKSQSPIWPIMCLVGR